MGIVMQTERLTLRELELEDAQLIHDLLNEPAWLEFIGDRGIHTLADARTYIADKLRPSYDRDGFGFWLTELTEDGTPLGICGMVKREALEHPDIGFALKEMHWGRGYALEAAQAVVDFARERARIGVLSAITNAGNVRSAHLLNKLGLEFDRAIRLPDDDRDIHLYLRDL